MTSTVLVSATGALVTIAGVHPVADLFPMLDGEELDDLAASISERGQEHAIVLDASDRVLDGRNRLAACERIGVMPEAVYYDGKDPDGYALTVNVARRHMTKGQRAMVVARCLSVSERHSSIPEAARLAGLSQARVGTAKTVLDHAPDLADAVVSGARSLDDAYGEARKRKAEQQTREEHAREQVARMASLRDKAPDLADLVTEERMALDEAVAAAKEREQRERDDARKANTALVTAVGELRQLAQPEAIERAVHYFAIGSCDATPTDSKHFQPDTLRAVADGLRALADCLENAA